MYFVISYILSVNSRFFVGFANTIIHGDALPKLQELDTESVDCIVTDPPYGYSFMNKDWDKAVVSVDIWKECLRVMKPGAFAFIMSSPRQDVLCKMILNLIDAGFETNFTSIYWTYASGFPKATNVSKLVDKRNGEKGEVVGQGNGHTGNRVKNHLGVHDDDNYEWKGKFDITKPKSEQAKKLDGSYAGFQPKPALETILVVMKPLSESSYVDQALDNQKGITWLDDCRIPFQNENDKNIHTNNINARHRGNQERFKTLYFGYDEQDKLTQINEKGRFPANLIVSDDALNDGKITKSTGGGKWTTREIYGEYKEKTARIGAQGLGDSGSYSRYFDLDAWFLAIPKASASERNKGLENSEAKETWALQRKFTSDPRMKHEQNRLPKQNHHPTVKPLKLMSYLITLGSRENDLILDPFCGSGTTCIAATMLNRKYIGIELNEEYVEIANKRLAPYLVQNKLTDF